MDTAVTWQDPEVSCVIPVYNEGPRLRGVLSAVHKHPLVKEVTVVDDASTDDPSSIVSEYQGVKLISLPHNQGKTLALDAGIRQCSGSLLMLIDGDLVGLTAQHITDLILPVVEGRADMAISLRQNAPRLWRLIGLDYISGERVFRRDVIAEPLTKLPRFGFEVYLNDLCIRRKMRIAVVIWGGVHSPFKTQKLGLFSGISADFRMIRDIVRTVSPFGLLMQIIRMLRLRIR